MRNSLKRGVSLTLASLLSAAGLSSFASTAEKRVVVADGLEYAYIDENFVELIGANDENATSVTIPAALNGQKVIVRDGAFSFSDKLTEINVAPDSEDLKSVDGALFSADGTRLLAYPIGREGAYSIPEGTVSVAPSAFERAKGLTYVEIPDSLSYIGEYAFKECEALAGFSKPLPRVFSGNVVYGCDSLKEIAFAEPDEPAELANVIFKGCKELESLTIPEGYVLTGSLRLTDCPKLKKIVLPEISDGIAISVVNCDALVSFRVPDGKEGASSRVSATFSGCDALAELSFGDIGEVAVKDSSALETIRFYGTSPAEQAVRIDCAYCPKLKNVYYSNEEAPGPSAETALLFAKYGVKVHIRRENSRLLGFLGFYGADTAVIEDELVYGDANSDGKVDMSDAVLILQSLSNPDRFSLTPEQRLAADVCKTGDGVTPIDAACVQRYLLRLIDKLPE